VSRSDQTQELFAAPSSGAPGAYSLWVVLDAVNGGILFEWHRAGSTKAEAVGLLLPCRLKEFRWFALDWEFRLGERSETDHCNRAAPSVRALLRRILKRLPLVPGEARLGFRLESAAGGFEAGKLHELDWPKDVEWSSFLARPIHDFIKLLESAPATKDSTPQQRGRLAMLQLLERRLALPVAQAGPDPGIMSEEFCVRITLDMANGFIGFDWSDAAGQAAAGGRVTCSGPDELRWELTVDGQKEVAVSRHHLNSIRAQLQRWRARFPVAHAGVSARAVKLPMHHTKPVIHDEPPFGPHESPWAWAEDNIKAMADAMRVQFSPLGRMMQDVDPYSQAEMLAYNNRLLRKERRREEEEQRRRETMARLAAERRARKLRAAEAQKAAARNADLTKKAGGEANHKPSTAISQSPMAECAPLPPVPLRIEMPALVFQDTAFPLTSLGGWRLAEQAARWWVSNQSDDLLALPYCRIQKLDYQVRSALRVLGPLRGCALLSDEVGLGKTIEAGLVLKEWLTRGMVKKFLVLTVPSLVDQWEEELSDKFNLTTVTTNHAAARADTAQFWRENAGIVASLHTLKQPAQLEIARTVHWDLVIVDEAHYLRNRESQAWQAVNALPRQFLLLLTATPVQNSIEELYNLVTLLQPGQLPTPKEFRARFIDPKRPRQPREPEELRRLLSQVMIRNTRANAGLNLPPRRAETVVFEAREDERAFWQSWEAELRAELTKLPAAQASLWGRLLLQTAGSSPSAWHGALEKFPNRTAVRAWRERAPLQASWQRKCELLPPLTRVEGGLVVFTQFLDTQAALAESLRAAHVETFVINGSTPAAGRQPITEQFRKAGGALLLTHSGTEGRNLQFCHRLVNFDLPWNPMEIEQRIGRLHRLGQQHPVRIYNLVQAGTLQEHLLQILQEKLNLFELVVGETGLVLGERFSSDEFAEEVLRRWRESEGRVAEALQSLGDELAAARDGYQQIKALDETLFAKDYETL
jgi:superfamily II DNA or RNA helicase